MEGSLADSILHVCKVLNKHSVEYLLIGGTAVALHGYYRLSRQTSGEVTEKHDLDFWYNSNYNNYFRLLDALEELGQDISQFKAEKSPNPKKSFFRLEYDKFTVDFLPELPGLSRFRDSFSKCEFSKIGEIEIPFISYSDLITNKQTQGRAKDIEDIEQLKLRRNDTE
jgi:predicted nucleotidyltransferase